MGVARRPTALEKIMSGDRERKTESKVCGAVPAIRRDPVSGLPIACILEPGHPGGHLDVRSDGENILWFDPIPGPWTID